MARNSNREKKLDPRTSCERSTYKNPMYNITVICTKHKEFENCNSMELHRIIESIRPEIIFEELSDTNFHKCYYEKSLITLETNAIKKYLQNNNIKHIPVDSYELPNSYYEDLDYMYYRIIYNNKVTDSQRMLDLLNKQTLFEDQYGFSFLNSNQNVELFEEINILKVRILKAINEEILFRTDKLEKEVIENREYEIINNIYNYSKDHLYTQAILFIGSGHRKSIMEKIEERKRQENITLNWTLYY